MKKIFRILSAFVMSLMLVLTACSEGENGKSTYDIAVENGFTGTVEEFNAFSKASNWNSNTGNYTVVYSDGTVSKK